MYSQNEGPAIQTLCLNKSSLDFSASQEPGSVTSSNSFMGKFIKLGITLLLWLKTPSCFGQGFHF